jgi:hypothetical protein
MQPFCRLVVARYNEDVSWTKIFPRATIYNKGSPLTGDFSDVRTLPNVGREGHTYYHYICDHYDELDDYTVFLQGNPFDHSPRLLEQLAAPIEGDFAFLSERIIPCNLSGCVWDLSLPMIPLYEHLFGERKLNHAFRFGQGAQFVVSKERIRRRPRDFYQRIVDLLSSDVNPIAGFVVERFHGLVFGD